MKVILNLQMNCTVISFQTTGGARHPLGPMDATPMAVSIIIESKLHYRLQTSTLFHNCCTTNVVQVEIV